GSLATVALFPPQPTGPALADKVRDYELHEPVAAVRLADGQIERNKKTLNQFVADSAYPALEPDLRAFVGSRLKEIEDYESYKGKLANAITPASVRSVPELEKVRHTLLTDLALPPEYAWGETAAAELRGKCLADT